MRKKDKQRILQEIKTPALGCSLKDAAYNESLALKRNKKRFALTKRKIALAICAILALFAIINVSSVAIHNSKVENQDKMLSLRQVQNKKDLKRVIKLGEGKKENIFQKLAIKGCASKDMSPPEVEGGGAQTNIQVEGIDEADVVKYSDNRIFYTTSRAFYVVDISLGSKVVYQEIFASNATQTSLYLANDNIVLLIDGQIIIYDKFDLKKKKEIKMNGELVDSRLIGDFLYVVINQKIDNYQEPSYYEDGEVKQIPSQSIYYCTTDAYQKYTQVFSINLLTFECDVKTQIGVATYEAIYMSNQALYLATVKYEMSRQADSQTIIYRYELVSNILTFDCLTAVVGAVESQWYMDEYEGYLRVASTNHNNAMPLKKNRVSVFDYSQEGTMMVEVGFLDEGIGLAYQKIHAVRFDKNYVSIVTYEQTDPLYKIEFIDHTIPKIISVYYAPGFSDYLHPMTIANNKYLLGLGYDDRRNIKLSFYDNNTDKQMQIGSDFILTGDLKGVFSEALTNHRAIFQMNYKEGYLFGFSVGNKYLLFYIDITDNLQPIKLSANIAFDYHLTGSRMVYVDEVFYTLGHNAVISLHMGENKQLVEDSRLDLP